MILPLSALLVAQLMGRVQISTGGLMISALLLTVLNALLLRLGVALFDRETILTRWK